MQIHKLDTAPEKKSTGNKNSGKSRFVVYSFRHNDAGQWRQRRSVETRKNALLRAKALFRTGKYQRIEVKQIRHSNTRQQPLTTTVKVLHTHNKPLIKIIADALPSISFAGLAASAAMIFWIS